MLRLFVGGWVLLWVVVGLAFYPLLGVGSLHALWGALAGALFWVIYRGVGRGVERLCAEATAAGLQPVESLIVSRLLQCPGVMILEQDHLILRPVLGECVTIPWRDITAFREVRWFNGQRLFAKTGFWFNVPGKERLGVAVPVALANDLRGRLKLAASLRPANASH
jgi:hypothetical protein